MRRFGRSRSCRATAVGAGASSPSNANPAAGRPLGKRARPRRGCHCCEKRSTTHSADHADHGGVRIRAHRTLARRAILVALLLPVALLAGAMACGPAGDGLGTTDARARDLERFRFFRLQQILIRLDSASGQVWSAPASGDGGWVQLGEAPSDGGQAQQSGRYIMQTIPKRTRALPGRNQNDLVRFDRSTGRAWLGSTAEGTRWTPIEDGADTDAVKPGPERPAEAEPVHATGNTGKAMPRATKQTVPSGGKQPKFEVIPKEKLFSPDPEADISVVMQALHKDGLPTSVRVWAVRQLGEFDSDLSVPRLLEALRHEEPEVVVAAIETLAKTGAVSTIPQILKLENHPDPRVREAVKRVVVDME